MKTLATVLKEQIKDREQVHVFISGPWMSVNTTGPVTPENEALWAQLDDTRAYRFRIGLEVALRILRNHHSNNRISTNANGMNYIEVTFDGYALKNGQTNWPYREQDYRALCDLGREFLINFIIGDSLTRYCFDRDLNLIDTVEIDDGGC